jgi:DNA-binding IclR family transcriptional regulator
VRCVQVINFLTLHPTESFTLSELSQRLGINLGSAHRILKALSEAGYLTRHPRHRTYALGAALVAVGQAALERHRVVEAAQREMQVIAEDLEVQCVAVAVLGDVIQVLARAGRPRVGRRAARVGHRLPSLPTLGPHWAWVPDEQLEAWLAAEGVAKGQAAFLRKALKTARRRGYSIALNGPALNRLEDPMMALADDPQNRALQREVTKLSRELSHDELQLVRVVKGRSYPVAHIAAPVFDADGELSLVLVLVGLAKRITAAQIERDAERIRTGAMVVMQEIHGRPPDERSRC